MAGYDTAMLGGLQRMQSSDMQMYRMLNQAQNMDFSRRMALQRELRARYALQDQLQQRHAMERRLLEQSLSAERNRGQRLNVMQMDLIRKLQDDLRKAGESNYELVYDADGKPIGSFDKKRNQLAPVGGMGGAPATPGPVPPGGADNPMPQLFPKGGAKPMNSSDRKRLEEMGNTLRSLVSVAKGFKPEYTNALGPVAGELENTVRKYAPVPQSVMSTDMPNWWAREREMVEIPQRAKTFGMTLTPREAADWQRVANNPGMKPEDISRNMNIRAAIVKMALDRAMRSAGSRHQRREVEEATGMSMPDNPMLNQYPSDDDLFKMGASLTGVGRPDLSQILSPKQQ